ncbi:MAG: tRNA lysidine(34) synthetase TilS [Anaerolineaceae bacterium]
MEKRIRKILDEDCGIQQEDTIIIGVSGGADSVFLLSIMHNLGFRVVVAHFDHQLRDSAKTDSKFVENLAKNFGLQFELGTADVKRFAIQEQKTIEEAARIQRYKFLIQTAEKYNSKFVMVAHNADDQVETVLMHFFRGSGLNGLIGMRPKTIIKEFHPSIFIIRPILSIWRDEILDYLRLNNIEFCFDETNLDSKFARNKIRNDLLPILTEMFPNIKSKVWNTSNILIGDQDVIQSQVDKKWESLVDDSKTDILRINRADFLSLSLGIQRHLLRRAVFHILPSARDISYESISRGIFGIKNLQTGMIELEKNLCIELAGESFYIFIKCKSWVDLFFPQVNIEENIEVDGCGIYEFGPGWFLKLTSHTHFDLPHEKKNIDSNMIEFDHGIIDKFPFFVSKKQNGDRFTPFGFGKGSIKLSDFFINEKIPRSARKNWPVLRDKNGKILWVIGIRPNDEFKKTSDTKKVLRLEVVKN